VLLQDPAGVGSRGRGVDTVSPPECRGETIASAFRCALTPFWIMWARGVAIHTLLGVVLDDKLVEACQRLTKIKTRRALIDHALQELLRREQQKKILGLKGKVKWEGDLEAWRKARP
jgi:Arc/MetJ family transcription regulator